MTNTSDIGACINDFLPVILQLMLIQYKVALNLFFVKICSFIWIHYWKWNLKNISQFQILLTLLILLAIITQYKFSRTKNMCSELYQEFQNNVEMWTIIFNCEIYLKKKNNCLIKLLFVLRWKFEELKFWLNQNSLKSNQRNKYSFLFLD